jgi:hypothetical protein
MTDRIRSKSKPASLIWRQTPKNYVSKKERCRQFFQIRALLKITKISMTIQVSFVIVFLLMTHATKVKEYLCVRRLSTAIVVCICLLEKKRLRKSR